MVTERKGKGEYAPTEEQILKELKQAEQRKAYMKSPKAAANRKKYQDTKKAQAAAYRTWAKEHPDEVAAIKAKHGIA